MIKNDISVFKIGVRKKLGFLGAQIKQMKISVFKTTYSVYFMLLKASNYEDTGNYESCQKPIP